MIIRGDSLEVLKTLEANSVDAVVTDPPYGWRFMGKAWDGEDIDRMTEERAKYQQSMGKDGKPRTSPRVAPSESAGKYDNSMLANRNFMNWTCLWATEAYRVLKPGGYMLVFCGPRTYHRMASGVEDAGFEIRDQLQWLFGSGFPKSLDVSKAIDKAAGAKREVTRVGQTKAPEFSGKFDQAASADRERRDCPASDLAKQWQGFGTALKPANEPIVLARKPLSEKTVAKNVLKHGTGALNIDGSRIAGVKPQVTRGASTFLAKHDGRLSGEPTQGRWPANILFDEEAAALLGEPSRFFYCAKSSKSERNAGLEGMPEKQKHQEYGDTFARGRNPETGERTEKYNLKTANHHPTVKPIRLMEYLCKLITPPGGIILDPFCGSGSTGVAATRLGFKFIGIEREKEYVVIAEKRIANAIVDEQLEL